MPLHVQKGLETIIRQTTHQGHPAQSAIHSASHWLGEPFKHGRAQEVEQPEVLPPLQFVLVGLLEGGITVDCADSALMADGIHQSREQQRQPFGCCGGEGGGGSWYGGGTSTPAAAKAKRSGSCDSGRALGTASAGYQPTEVGKEEWAQDVEHLP